MYIRRISAVTTKIVFWTLSEQADDRALVDSGATENFIDYETWKQMGVGKRPLAKPLTVYNVDGSENKQGKITDYCMLHIIFQGWQWLQKFYIASLGKDSIILGYPFLYVFQPTINWQKGVLSGGEVSLQTSRYKYRYKDIAHIQKKAFAEVGKPKEGEAIYLKQNIAQEWAKEASKGQAKLLPDTIPEEYRRHVKVFSDEEAKRFPPEREEDMSIKLSPDAPTIINCKVYPLSRDEWEQLQKFLATELELGQIKEGPSPYTSPVYFINKKDFDEKRIIMDYRELNKWTVCDNNLLPNIRELLKNFRGKGCFSKFDIRWGYNNIWIKKED